VSGKLRGMYLYIYLAGAQALWITHKENGPLPTTRAQCGLVGANDCKCNRDQRFNMPSEARKSLNVKCLVTHPMLLNFRDRTPPFEHLLLYSYIHNCFIVITRLFIYLSGVARSLIHVVQAVLRLTKNTKSV
jgi:hypothetical protein